MIPSKMDLGDKKSDKFSSKMTVKKYQSTKLNQEEARNLLMESSVSDMSELSDECDSEWTISNSPIKKVTSNELISRNQMSTPSKHRMKGLVSPINLKRKSSMKGKCLQETEPSEPLKEIISKDNAIVESPDSKRITDNTGKMKRNSTHPDSPASLASERTPRKCRSIYKSPVKDLLDSENKELTRRKCSMKQRSARNSPRPMKDVNYCEQSPPKRGRRSSVRFNDSPSSKQLPSIPQTPPTPVEHQPEVFRTPTRTPTRSSALGSPRTPSNSISLRKQVLESRASAKKKLGFGVEGSPKGRKPRISKKENSSDEDDIFVSSPSRPSSRLSTPSSPRVTPRKSTCPRVGQGFLTPQLPERSSCKPAPFSCLEQLTSRLHVSTVPTSLPCRAKEFDNIHSFILTKIIDKSGGCMYVSGVPGTGKTATTHAVVRSLQQDAVNGEISPFDFIEVNGLRLTEPRQAYVRIWQYLSGAKVSVGQALNFLEKRFSSRSKSSTVLLVDEVDYVCNRRQDVVYNLVEWSTWTHSRLILIFIANTMDLPERTLKGKIASRMGLTRLVFQPYNYKQLQEIVTNRLLGNSNFHADAVQLVSRKVAAVSGDARRALEICRSAVQLVGVDPEGSGIITVCHVQKAISQIFSGTRVQAIKHCGLMGQLILRSVRDECLRSVTEETDIRRAYSHLMSLCALEGVTEPNVCQMIAVCRQLAASALLTMESPCRDVLTKLALNVSSDDIHYALSPQSND